MASKARRRTAAAPSLTAHQTEALLGFEFIREGLAKLEALPAGNQAEALIWARQVYPAEEGIWTTIETWLRDD